MSLCTFFPLWGGKEGTKCLDRLLGVGEEVGGKYEPSFNPLPPPRLSLARAAATEAQQRQHSWSACKRKGDTAREGRGGHAPGAPPPPTLGAPLGGHLPWPRAPVPPEPTAGPRRRRGGRTRAGGRTPWSGAGAAAADGAHSPHRPGARRSRCGARWEPPPPQLTSRAGRAGASPPPTACAPSLRRAPAAERPPAAPLGERGAPRAGAGARLRVQTAGGLCPCLPARLPASLCVCLGLCERLRLPGKAAPAGSPSAPEPSARLSTAR